MNNILLAVDDGITNANYNWADVFFLVATIAGALAALGYLVNPAIVPDTTTPPTRYYRRTHWAAALVAVAVACTAFALFLL